VKSYPISKLVGIEKMVQAATGLRARVLYYSFVLGLCHAPVAEWSKRCDDI
jgi:hypothetical protein